jgi:hypothetical protein
VFTKRTNNPINKQINKLSRQFSKEEIKMANKNMKQCSTSLAKKVIQITTILRCCLTPIRLASIKKTNSRW